MKRQFILLAGFLFPFCLFSQIMLTIDSVIISDVSITVKKGIITLGMEPSIVIYCSLENQSNKMEIFKESIESFYIEYCFSGERYTTSLDNWNNSLDDYSDSLKMTHRIFPEEKLKLRLYSCCTFVMLKSYFLYDSKLDYTKELASILPTLKVCCTNPGYGIICTNVQYASVKIKETEEKGFYKSSFSKKKFARLLRKSKNKQDCWSKGDSLAPVSNFPETELYIYHPDHLGSSSWITDNGGKAIQHLHYLPWGEQWIDQRNTGWNAPFTFSAKERDEETGYSYFGARYYDSELSIFLSVDPMSDKYPHISSYAYCANNPLRYIDPNGEDIWELDEAGNITKHTKTKEFDKFIVNGKEKTFKYGTVEKAKTQTYSKDGKTDSYDFYKVRGDDNGTELFEFVASNTNVEWSQAKMGQEGDKGLNYLTTSHEDRAERGMGNLINGQLRFGYTAREFNHSHPISNKGIPSGLEDGRKDIGFARDVSNIFGQNVKFNIFTPKTKEYHSYGPHSKKSDYYGKSFHEKFYLINTIYQGDPFEEIWKTMSVQEYIFKDSLVYNQLINLIAEYQRNIEETGALVFEYSDSLKTFIGFNGEYYLHNLSMSTLTFGLYDNIDLTNKVKGMFYFFGKKCLILNTSVKAMNKLFVSTNKKHKFKYRAKGFTCTGGEINWNMMLHNNGKLELKGTEFDE